MATDKTALQKRIESGESILIAEIAPPKGGDPGPVRASAKRFAGKVRALGIGDNRYLVAQIDSDSFHGIWR